MLQRARQRLTYANVMSSAALFITLGGTSYALTLPRNSVGAKQIRGGAVRASEIRSGAVGSSDVKDRSLGVRDLSTAARGALRGQAGATGPPGPQGPSGITYRATINSAGQLLRGNPKFNTTRGLNEYLVEFDRSAADCVATATLAANEGPDDPPAPAGRITVARENSDFVVRTYDAGGSVKGIGFDLIVAC